MLFKRSEAAAAPRASGASSWRPRPTLRHPPHPAIGWRWNSSATRLPSVPATRTAPPTSGKTAARTTMLSYGAMTAAAFNADYRNIAVSGMGVVVGWVPFRAAEAWTGSIRTLNHSGRISLFAARRSVREPRRERRLLHSRQGRPFPATFSPTMLGWSGPIRLANPASEIVLLRGGMFGGAKSPALRQPWEAAVAELERMDPKITHFVFQHWSSNHPRVSDDRAMADELTAWLKHQPFIGVRAGRPLSGS